VPDARYSPSQGGMIHLNLVVHVAHSGSNGRYTVQQIRDIVATTNAHFAGNGWGRPNAGVDTKIVWRLATKDENGNPTSGITFHNSAYWFGANMPFTSRWNNFIQSTSWDPRRFANVYVYGMTDYCGFAWYASDAAGSWFDGMNMNKNCMSTLSSTLAHEMGHYLNLIHTFGSNNGGQGSCHSDAQCLSHGDKICDTGTESSSTGNVGASCTPEWSCGSPDPIQNYMDYTRPNSCSDQFTEEQARRMRCTIAAWRSNIVYQWGPPPLPSPPQLQCFGAVLSASNDAYDCLASDCRVSRRASWYGTLADAKALCTACPSCAALHDWGGDGRNWRACRSVTAGSGAKVRFNDCRPPPPPNGSPPPPSSLVERCTNPPAGAPADFLRIVGGTELDYPRELPFMASLFSSWGHICGGSLVAPTWVVTAAHCTTGGAVVTVKVGMHRKSCSSSSCDDCVQVRTVKRKIEHSGYSSVSLRDDIALIELSSPVDYAPIATYAGEGANLEAAGTPVVVSGWGTLSSGGSSPDIANKVTVPIYSDAACRQAYGSGSISSGMVCAGLTQGGKDSCQGDSGGPLFYDDPAGAKTLIGIVSWGAGCADAGLPGVYTRVSSYASWLCQQTNSLYLCNAASSLASPVAAVSSGYKPLPPE